MQNKPLINVAKEKYLGIIVSKDLKSSQQCIEATKKAGKMLGLIGRSFEFRSRDIILRLYNSMVRPHLEYAVQFWTPHLRKDIDRVERIPRRATKLIPELRNKSYENRLRELKLFSMEKRRLRGDMIKTFKIIKGLVNVKYEKYFNLDISCTTRNNGFKLKGKRYETDIAGHYFFNRVINEWNKLPAHVVASNTLEIFKSRLDKYYQVLI